MYKFLKRFIDIIISLLGIILLSPVFIVTAVLIKMDSIGPIIFKQKRLGINGLEFDIYKFRSMKLDSEKKGVYELKGDSRITKVGKIIRKTSVDELPQFLNVIKGDMSLIGPRPPLTYHPWSLDLYTTEQKKMFSVRPGVTGWAQVNGRKNVEWNERIRLNVEYVENLSILFDFKIFLMTAFKIFNTSDNINNNETVTK